MEDVALLTLAATIANAERTRDLTYESLAQIREQINRSMQQLASSRELLARLSTIPASPKT